MKKEQEQPVKRTRKAPEYKPWHPEPYEVQHVAAIQALVRGDASAYQQQTAIGWIINNLCRTYDLPYHPDSHRDTDFALGKQSIGKQLVKMTNLQTSKLTGKDTEQG